MSTTTARLGLYKPADTGAENINVTTDLNNNLDILDSKVGVFPCTSSTRPGTPYDGQLIFETDTDRMYVWSTDNAAWLQMIAGNTTFLSSLATNGLDASGPVDIRGGLGTNNLFTMGIDGEGGARFQMQADSKFKWGGGGGTYDVNLYREAADILATDDSLHVASNLDVDGTGIFGGDVTFSTGQINLGSTRRRGQLSSTGTVGNTASEALLAQATIPAGDSVAGALYRVQIRGLASCTGTPTLTLRIRLGGTTLTGTVVIQSGAVTFASGATTRPFTVDMLLSVITTGGSGTVRAVGTFSHLFGNTTALPTSPTSLMDATTAAVTMDTTATRLLELTAQWSAANVANTVTVYVVNMERLA